MAAGPAKPDPLGFYYHADGLGSITNVTDSGGVKQWSHIWEPYGTVRTQTQDALSAPTNPMRFAGEYEDATVLYHLRARQYDPSTGRFTTLDPLPNPVMSPYMSAYAYANNRPTVLTDPSGLRAGTCGSIICWVKDAPRKPTFDEMWEAARWAGFVVACAEGASVGAVAGPVGAAAGCVAVAIAFDIAAENAKHGIEDALDIHHEP